MAHLEAGAEGVSGDGKVGNLDAGAVVEPPHHAQVVLHLRQVVQVAQDLYRDLESNED